MNAPAIKLKKCRMCPNKFPQFNSLHVVCSPACAIRMAEEKPKALVTLGQRRLKEERKADRQKKLAIKTLSEWKAEVQEVFNKFIRMRDEFEPCISCGREHVEWTVGGAWDCGHYLSVGSHPELRFEELNAYKQCKSCNGGSGKYARKNRTVSKEYRERLIARIGLGNVEWLEGPHEPKHYKIPELIELKAHYKAKIKEIENV